MTQPEVPEDLAWDDIVDVICVGDGPGVQAYGTVCAAAGLDVIHVAAPAVLDPGTAAYLAAMTEDLTDPPDGDDPAAGRVTPAPLRRDARGRPDVLETFVGEHLRQWSARCLASPSGVLFTAVTEVLARMRTAGGEIITAAPVAQAHLSDPVEVFAGPIYQDGVLAGALLDGPSGPRRVRAHAGLGFAVGDPAPAWPPGADALVSRPYARFARLEAVEVVDD